MEILTENHTKVLPEKYAKVVLQIATLEERISAMMSFGFTKKSKMLSDNLVQLLQSVKDEYERDQKRRK